MPRQATTAAALVALAALAGMTGCSQQAMKIDGGEAALAADEGSPGFLDRVASQAVISQNDALRGILLLLDKEDKTKTFQQRVEKLTERGVCPRGWGYGAARPMTKGRLAYMVYQACKVPGGVILTLTGPSQRYCLRELQYRKMMSAGTPWNQVTGLEFVAVLSRADTYLQSRELPGIMEATSGGM